MLQPIRLPYSFGLLAGLFLAVSCNAPLDRDVAEARIWTDLWDGGPLDGWQMAGPGGFEIEDGAIRAHGGMGLLWYAPRTFGDFELQLEWMAEGADDNSGVFVRFPDPGVDPWVAVNEGYEMQICDTADAKHRTGSVYDFQDASAVPTNPAGEWNRYTIRVVGQVYTLYVNGMHVNTFVGERGIRGHVGLQNHDDGSPVRFRAIRVRELGR
ncbi:MAG TPA: DUF1080 domain-containing protein [Planctomycetota bacterium]